MRIDLGGREEQAQARRRGRRRRSQRFDSSLAIPQASPRDSARRTRPEGARRTSTGRRGKRRQRSVAGDRSSAPRRIRLRVVLARLPAVLFLAGLVAASAYVSIDEKFFVYEAQIIGTRYLKPQAIYRAAQVHQQNIFWIRPKQVAERVVRLEGIKAVRVRCGLPARVTIEVWEREPAVMWRAQSQGQDLWLDTEGIVLPYHGDVSAPDTVFVVDSSERHLQQGDRIEPEGIVHSVLQLATALPGAKIFFYEAARGLYFTQQVDGGEWPVYVGTSEDLPRKIQVVQALTEYLVAHNIQPRYVDVRWADHPVYGRPEDVSGGGGN